MTWFFVIACLHPIITLHSPFRALHLFIATIKPSVMRPMVRLQILFGCSSDPVDSLSLQREAGIGAGQQPRWAGLLLPVLSSGVPLLSAILRAPGWLLAVSLLLPGRTGHLSDCHALQLVDSKNAGTSLRMLVGTSGAMLLRSARRPASFVRNVTYTLKTVFHSLCKKKHFKIRQLYI